MQAQVVEKMRNVYRVCRDIALFPKNLSKVKRIVDGHTYFPEKRRKPKSIRLKENLAYLLKNHEVNIYYNSYGLDIVGFHNEKDYISHREFILNRYDGNNRFITSHTGEYNYITLLRDKYVFSAYLASTLGQEFVPKSVGIINKGKVYLTESKEWLSVNKFLEQNFVYVLKKIDGECADGVSLVKNFEGRIISSEKEYTKAEYIRKLSGSRILIQECLQQHESIEKINPNCVNTIRIVTLADDNGNIGIFAAFLRLGVVKDSFVDNRAKGGLGVGINLETGKLREFGFAHDAFGAKLSAHPLTDVIFKDYQLPYWNEVKELVINAHKQFYELESIGWDIVITPNGPVILEGNDDWEIGGPQDTSGGLKKRWIELTKKEYKKKGRSK